MTSTVEVELVLSLFTLQSKIQKRISGALSPHGISFTEYLVLSRLKVAPQSTLRRVDLAEEVGLTASGITRLINPMEKIGLVDKQSNARDARVSLVVLTAAGQRIYAEAQKSFGHAAESVFSNIDTAQQESLLQSIHGLH